MSFLLVYELIWGEVILIILGIVYIAFHTGHGLFAKVGSIREFHIFQKKERSKILRKHTIEQKKIETQIKKEEVSLNAPKKKLTAHQRAALEAIFKLIPGKLANREYAEARAQIIEGLIIDRGNVELNVLLAQLYEKEDDYEKAEIIFRDIILQSEPKKSDLYVYLGDNLIYQGKHALAYDVYKKGLEKEPRNAQILEILAELAYEFHEYEEALLYARRLTEAQPKNARGFELLGLAHLQVGADQKAFDTFLTLRKLDPYNEVVHLWLPKVEEKLGVSSELKRLNAK